jgi:hypothetical protein
MLGAIRHFFLSALLANLATTVSAEEIPLGGRYDGVAERFNRVAGKMKLDVRLERRECKADVLCRYTFNASILGHGSAIDIGQPTLETMLFTHDCSAADAIVLRDAAAVFVKMFGAGAASSADLDRLASRVAGEAGGQTTVVIGGVEFTNSATSCTLLIARPLREPSR